MFNRIFNLTLVTFFSAVLLACGGGGGGTPAAPAVAAEPVLNFTQSKAFRFTWIDAPDATFYRLLENPDGGSGFTQVGADIAQGAEVYDHIVPLYARLNAQYILQSCNAGGCTDFSVLAVSGSLVAAIGYLKASNTEAGDRFGIALSLSGDGNTLAVGAYFEDSNAVGDQADNSQDSSGAVYVFTRSGSTWNQQAYLKASNTDIGDRFGFALALNEDGNTLAVGAYFESSNAVGVDGDQADNSMTASGAVYVFTRGGSTWSQQAYLKASNTEAVDRFGYTLSLDNTGNTLAVGAYLEDSNANSIDGNQLDNSEINSGAVYIFTSNNGSWGQQAYLKASNAEEADFFGVALTLNEDGNTLAVGAYREDSGTGGNQLDNTATNSGAVYVFARIGGIWSQQAYLKANNIDIGDRFGVAVSLSADSNTLAVAANFEDSSANGVGGNPVSNVSADSGAVYVFTRSGGLIGGTWSQQAYLKASNTDTDDLFGTSVGLSDDGNTLAVGAAQEDSNAIGINNDQNNNLAPISGSVYIFTRINGLWDQQAYLKASNTQANDQFGFALDLSGDGNTLAVAASLEDSNALDVGGNQTDNSENGSGAVYLY
ncbi:Type IV pilus biogenesis protein PilO [hydrothermal vent metagenome]|uniref:Type IV pilus biogenesis protein PilO n=1 Tax=hydrothermal vent metagenome TaxID=652676 RepID=A0A3B1AMV2_9ZZZZ